MPCKITVLKNMFFQDIYDDHVNSEQAAQPCNCFTEGQEFEIDSFFEVPEDFSCSWAWNDIYKTVSFVFMENDLFPTTKDGSNYVVACCTSGYKPVLFKVELIEEEAMGDNNND